MEKRGRRDWFFPPNPFVKVKSVCYRPFWLEHQILHCADLTVTFKEVDTNYIFRYYCIVFRTRSQASEQSTSVEILSVWTSICCGGWILSWAVWEAGVLSPGCVRLQACARRSRGKWWWLHKFLRSQCSSGAKKAEYHDGVLLSASIWGKPVFVFWLWSAMEEANVYMYKWTDPWEIISSQPRTADLSLNWTSISLTFHTIWGSGAFLCTTVLEE